MSSFSPCPGRPSRDRPALEPEQVVENAGETAAATVQRVGEAAQEVSEQLAVTGLTCDLEVHLVEIYNESE